MINWTLPQGKISLVIRKLGFQVTLTKADSSTAKAYGAWDSNSKQDLAQGGHKITSTDKQIYIDGKIKKAPEVGDTLKQGTSIWSITEVEEYKPSTVVLAYRVRVQ